MYSPALLEYHPCPNLLQHYRTSLLNAISPSAIQRQEQSFGAGQEYMLKALQNHVNHEDQVECMSNLSTRATQTEYRWFVAVYLQEYQLPKR